MLSRVADALFWMSRYVERAEQTARLLDVWFHLELDLSGVGAAPFEMHWNALSAILQARPTATSAGQTGLLSLSQWLTFEPHNPASILACLSKARLNARGIRGTLDSEVWRELNKLYWRLQEPDFVRRSKESPYELYQVVEVGSALFQGQIDSATTHDEGWHFIQLGKFVERADKTLRILDVQHQVLSDLTDPADLSLTNLHWAAVLKSCKAYEPYQRRNVGRVEPEGVLEFLLLDPSFSRSVRFSLEAIIRHLAAIEGETTGQPMTVADRLLGLMRADLAYRPLQQLRQGDLHEFLRRMIDQLAHVSRAVQERYSLR
jgi:uncharacterized alpha-E superfamily protein